MLIMLVSRFNHAKLSIKIVLLDESVPLTEHLWLFRYGALFIGHQSLGAAYCPVSIYPVVEDIGESNVNEIG